MGGSRYRGVCEGPVTGLLMANISALVPDAVHHLAAAYDGSTVGASSSALK